MDSPSGPMVIGASNNRVVLVPAEIGGSAAPGKTRSPVQYWPVERLSGAASSTAMPVRGTLSVYS
jgi:hypothetical protein